MLKVLQSLMYSCRQSTKYFFKNQPLHTSKHPKTYWLLSPIPLRKCRFSVPLRSELSKFQEYAVPYGRHSNKESMLPRTHQMFNGSKICCFYWIFWDGRKSFKIGSLRNNPTLCLEGLYIMTCTLNCTQKPLRASASCTIIIIIWVYWGASITTYTIVFWISCSFWIVFKDSFI